MNEINKLFEQKRNKLFERRAIINSVILDKQGHVIRVMIADNCDLAVAAFTDATDCKLLGMPATDSESQSEPGRVIRPASLTTHQYRQSERQRADPMEMNRRRLANAAINVWRAER